MFGEPGGAGDGGVYGGDGGAGGGGPGFGGVGPGGPGGQPAEEVVQVAQICVFEKHPRFRWHAPPPLTCDESNVKKPQPASAVQAEQQSAGVPAAVLRYAATAVPLPLSQLALLHTGPAVADAPIAARQVATSMRPNIVVAPSSFNFSSESPPPSKIMFFLKL